MTDCRTTSVTITAAVADKSERSSSVYAGDPLPSAGKRPGRPDLGVPRRSRSSTWPA
jgi:hypothetical protein